MITEVVFMCALLNNYPENLESFQENTYNGVLFLVKF